MVEEKKTLSKKAIRKAYLDWCFLIFLYKTLNSMEGPAIVKMLADVREEIYPNDKEAQKEMLERHTIFFNTEPNLGSIVPGIVLGMEYEMAQGGDVQPEFINSIKTALMGPFAGIGDSLLPGTLCPILLSLPLVCVKTEKLLVRFLYYFFLSDYAASYLVFVFLWG